jgi:hypothetical protein
MTPVIYARLRSYARLRLEDMTPIIYPNSGCTSQLRSTSWLLSYLLTPVTHHDSGRWACRMSCQLICERLHMAELDDCNILQLKHLVRSNLSRVHDLFSVQNLSISRLHMFKCQAMYLTTNEHLSRLDLTETRVSRRTQYPCNLSRSKTSNV